MPGSASVEAELLEAVRDVVGPARREEAEQIVRQIRASFRAHGWGVLTWAEINADDLPRYS